MALNNKTSANLVAWMMIEDVAPAGFELTQFDTDAGVVAEQIAEVQADMTLDGKLVVGYTPNPQVVNITLQPTSPAVPYFRELQQTQRTRKQPLQVDLTVSFPATGRNYVFSGGVLTQGTAMPAGNRVQGVLNFQFTFEKVA
jgi:hypothetical protein|nr:MAG TPA: Protein of unknown function (DUF3277) [Caudoviricetes sp.]